MIVNKDRKNWITSLINRIAAKMMTSDANTEMKMEVSDWFKPSYIYKPIYSRTIIIGLSIISLLRTVADPGGFLRFLEETATHKPIVCQEGVNVVNQKWVWFQKYFARSYARGILTNLLRKNILDPP